MKTEEGCFHSRLFPLNNFNLPVYSIVIHSDRAKVLGNNLHSAWKIIIERNFRYAEKVKYPLKSNRELLFEKDKFRQFLIDARESKILSLVERRDDLPPPIFHEERERERWGKNPGTRRVAAINQAWMVSASKAWSRSIRANQACSNKSNQPKINSRQDNNSRSGEGGFMAGYVSIYLRHSAEGFS